MEATTRITLKTVTPTLNFDGNTEEVFDFYKSVFGGEFSTVLRFRDLDGMEGLPDHELDRIAHITLPLGNGHLLMGADSLESFGKSLTVGNNFYITLEPKSAEDAERLFDALAAGGHVEMPLEKTEWAEKFGQCADRFGVQWMINYTGDVDFSGSQEEAS